MCVGGGSTPAPPPKLPEAPRTAEPTGRTGTSADEKRRRAAAGGSTRSTVLTSSRGITDGATGAAKTLLGQ